MALATADDVALRYGRDLTTDEVTTVESIITTVTGLIVDEVDRDGDWADELAPVPAALKALCVEKALQAIANPSGLATSSETLGAYSYQRTFPRSQDGGLFLTPQEGRLARSAVYGSLAGSSAVRAAVDRVIDLRENRHPDEEA